jgi:YVTN family beta-propeller protein
MREKLRRALRRAGFVAVTLTLWAPLPAGYTNFEVSHVHPVDLTPTGGRLLVVNTPDALLEVFSVQTGGGLSWESSIPVGLEPVSVVARTDDEAWVVNQLSDTVSIVDLTTGLVVETIDTGDEPTDVAFANGKAFVSVSGEDRIEVFDLGAPGAGATSVPIFSRKPRALAVSTDGSRVYAVTLHSGNQTTIVNSGAIFGNGPNLDSGRLTALGLNDLICSGAPPPYPPLPSGITRNPVLPEPAGGIPQVGLIVRWNESTGRWEDDAGQNWTNCLPFRLPDHDLFAIDTTTLGVTAVDHLGTSLFDVSVHPTNGKIYVPNTEARNFVRFEHPSGVQGHIVDNRLSIVDPGNAFSVQVVDLNTHIDRNSDPSANTAERAASISQPGMMVWHTNGNSAWLIGIGTRKLFRIDASCSSGSCIFGPDRGIPAAVEVGEGPTGVALHEGENRVYVLNRFSNSIAIVDAGALQKLDEIPLHDPSPITVKQGRRLLYDAIIGSGHGDNACSSCHLFGDRDDLAWDLGNPAGDFAPYATTMDNVRFIVPLNDEPTTCDADLCAAQSGFDPQKGPMTTQTLRGMLEPLHWRGDRATMNDFNPAFPGLMGTADIGPINGKPAGLSAADMESFRQFALGIRFQPNPHREVDDTLANEDVTVRGSPVPGNPTTGETVYNTFATDAGQPCLSCHAHPFGAAGGTLGGVEPAEPTSGTAAALFNGNADQSLHSDLKVAHLRNMYEKVGPAYGDHIGPPPEAASGFGFTHDGALPDLATFFSFSVFTLSAEQAADVASFALHFPTGTKPAVGRHLTLPAGTPPTGTVDQENLLGVLTTLGDLVLTVRHCELVATTSMGGRVRSFHLSGGVWVTDVAGEASLTTVQLREQAQGPVSFLCAPLDSGVRLGGDRDEDNVLNGDDCASADPETWNPPQQATGLSVGKGTSTHLAWDELASSAGPSMRYELLGGDLSDLRALEISTATGCVAGDLADPQFDDTRPAPAAGEGLYYLVRGRNVCDVGATGAGRESLDPLTCPAR